MMITEFEQARIKRELKSMDRTNMDVIEEFAFALETIYGKADIPAEVFICYVTDILTQKGMRHGGMVAKAVQHLYRDYVQG